MTESQTTRTAAPARAHATITDLACDLRNAGWTDTDTRVRDGLAVCEWTRNGLKAWALVDIATNAVIGGEYR